MTLMLLVLSAGLVACGNDDDDAGVEMQPVQRGTFTDVRDGNSYTWVRYGKLDWMAENFRMDTGNQANCLLYEDKDGRPVDIMKYGRLYTYSGALEACPEGWRLPTDDDWKQLEMSMGMSLQDAGRRDWRGDIAGRMLTAYDTTTDINLILGGYYTYHTIMATSGFRFLGVFAFYWTATQDKDKGAGYYFYRKMIYNAGGVFRESMEPNQFLSVRYVRDAQ